MDPGRAAIGPTQAAVLGNPHRSHVTDSAAAATSNTSKGYLDQLPLLDGEIFEGLRAALQASTLDEIYGTCISQSLSRCQTAREAANRSDWPAVAGAAHAISGSAAMVGAVRLAAAARSMEFQGAPHPSLETALTEIERCCQQLSQKLKEEGFSV